MAKKKPQQEKLVTVGVRVPPILRAVIERRAEEEERSKSQIIARLLLSHPDLKKDKQLAIQA
jgi:hypothetical protein